MYSDVELEAYDLYEEYVIKTFNEGTPGIDFFLQRRKSHESFFYYATINIRKEKLEKLNKICTAN